MQNDAKSIKIALIIIFFLLGNTDPRAKLKYTLWANVYSTSSATASGFSMGGDSTSVQAPPNWLIGFGG